MCTSSWPEFLDLTRDECKRVLRNLELDAYGCLVSAFRAQGDLNKDKKKLLQELQHSLSISTERHRAEIRRAVNDEKLATVADNLSGTDVSSEWQVEGRRLVPIMPRLVPQTAFSLTADNAANQQARRNLNLPSPSATGNKDLAGASAPPISSSSVNTTPIGGRAARASSPTPTSNVLVLPSGLSIHIKEDGQVATEEEKHLTRRRRSSSAESLIYPRQPVSMVSTTAQPPRVPSMSTSAPSQQPNPQMKLTVAKSSPVKHHSVTTTSSGQKVIIVSSTHGTPPATVSSVSQAASSSFLQRAVSAVPVVKNNAPAAMTSTVSSMMYPRPSVMVSSSADTPGRSNIITIAATGASTGVSSSITPQYHHSSPGLTTAYRPRVRTISARPRTPQHTPRPSIHSSSTPHPIAASTGQNIHIRPSPKPTIHIKQEGGMKIITQGTPSTAGRILPKPSGSQVLMVSTAPSPLNVVSKTASLAGGHIQGGKVLNISTSGGRILATSTPRSQGSNVVTVNPKTLQLTTMKSAGGTTVLTTGSRIAAPTGTGKPNVIVVQKAQSKKGGIATTPTVQVARSSAATNSPFEKELVSFLQRQEIPGKGGLTQQQKSVLERRVGRPSTSSGDVPQRKHVVVHQKVDGSRVKSVTLQGGSKSSILAELIQAVGMASEGSSSGEHTMSEDLRAIASITSDPARTPDGASKPRDSSGVQNQWLEYDVQGDGSTVLSSDATDASAIKALLDLQAGTSTSRGPIQRQSSLEVGYVPHQGSEVTVVEQLHGVERPDSPDLQIIGTSGLDDDPTLAQTPTIIRRRIAVPQHRQKVQVVDETGASIQVQIANPEDLNQLAALASRSHNQSQVQEVIGDFDPKTGTLYTSGGIQTASDQSEEGEGVSIQVISSEDHEAEQAAILANTGATKTIILTSASDKTMSSSIPTEATTTVLDPASLGLIDQAVPTSAERIDFLSSALNQAQIDLETYQFDEEAKEHIQEVYVPSAQSTEIQSTTLVSILNRPTAPTYASTTSETGGRIQVISQDALQELVSSSSASIQSNRVVTKVSGIQGRVLPSQQGRVRTQFIPMHELEKKGGMSTIHVIKSGESVSAMGSGLAASLPSSTTVQLASGVSVAAEPGGLDPGLMKLEDLSSHQQLEGEISGEEMIISGYLDSSGDAAQNIRLSKRKRKVPLAPDEIPSPSHHIGWARLALGVLQRVMRVRGAYKEKGEMNAASWFTQPVDIREVPDYYDIIQNPMDFATVKQNLESGQYLDLEEFQADMLLVRDNCHRYNPPETEVRRDCEEVFSFFLQEYEKLIARCQPGYSSPSGKKIRLDRSPVRP